MLRSIELFVVFTVLGSVYSLCEVAEPLDSVSHNADDSNRFDPRDSDHNEDQSIFFTEGDPFTISYFVVETKSYSVKLFDGDTESTDCDLLLINIVSDQDLYDVRVNILEYGEIVFGEGENSDVFATNITKVFGNVDTDEVSKVEKKDYVEGSLIPTGVEKFRVVISYRTVSGGSRHYVTLFLWEDQSKLTSSQRWNIGYGGNLANIPFETYFGDTDGFNSYTSQAAKVDNGDEIASLNASGVIAAIFGVLFALIFIKVGYFLLIKFGSVGVELTGLIFIYMGIMYIAATIGLIFDIPQVKQFFMMADSDEVKSVLSSPIVGVISPVTWVGAVVS